MNIFYVDRDPIVAAHDLNDRHIIKMPIEATQMLANCFSLGWLEACDCPKTQKGTSRKYSYYNHPCSVWVRTSQDHFVWLLLHASALCKEKNERWPNNKPHFVNGFLEWCYNHINEANFEGNGWVDPPQCMPKQYQQSDPVNAYRAYYIGEKLKSAKWTNCNPPEWCQRRK